MPKQLMKGNEALLKGAPAFLSSMGAMTASTWAQVTALYAQAAAWVAANAPLLIIIGTIALVAAGVYLLVQHWDTITEKVPILGAAFEAVKGAIQGFVGFVTGTLVPAIKDPISALQAVKLARQGVTAVDLQRFLNGAARSPDELRSETWRQGFHNQVLQAALAVKKSPEDATDYEECVHYFLGHWPGLADRTRSSIEIGVESLLFVLNTGLARSLISTTTNFDIGDLARGKWLFVDTSPSVLGEAGLLIGASLKYIVQKDILRREARAGDGFVTVWLDEYAQWATSFDARQFLPMCRSHRGCLVALTQSIHGLRAALGGASEHEANALLSSFHHRFFHALGSTEDAEFASELVGQRHRMLLGGSLGPAQSLGEELFGGRSRHTSNFSTQLEAVIQPRAFLNGLRCGGPANDFLTDVIIVRTGEPFANGENFLRATFRQS